MCCEYEVRVAVYKTAKGDQAQITFKNGAENHFQESLYWKLWGKGSRLYFLPASPTSNRLTVDNTLIYSKPDMVNVVKPFVGEYASLSYDEQTHYNYIDLNNRTEISINKGLRLGKSLQSPKLVDKAKEVVVTHEESRPNKSKWIESADALNTLFENGLIDKPKLNEMRMELLDKILEAERTM